LAPFTRCHVVKQYNWPLFQCLKIEDCRDAPETHAFLQRVASPLLSKNYCEGDIVMKRKNENRTRIIGLRLSVDEFDSVSKKWKQSDCTKLSEFVRKKLFDKAMVRNYRNRSLDDFMNEMILLRRQLEQCQIGFNESIQRLHQTDRKPDVLTWLKLHDVHKRTLQTKIDEIKARINQISDTWLQ